MQKKNQRNNSLCPRGISRRDFLLWAAATATGLLAGCSVTEQPSATPTSKPIAGPLPTDTPIPTSTPTTTPPITPIDTPTSIQTVTFTSTPTTVPTIAPTNTSTPTLPPPSRAKVAVAQANSYERNLVRQQVQAMLDGLGGLDDVISPGDRVGIKVNLTGGAGWGSMPVPATESYMTHPEVVRALGELLRDAGAGELLILEGVYQWEAFPDYMEIAGALDATLINLNTPAPYPDFAVTPVGEDWFIYENFFFNHILEEVDFFVSVAKMKCHWWCGVTHSIKNLVGLVPLEFYRLAPDHTHRSALHGSDDEIKARLPRVIMDLYQARPIHLALIDGIKTVEAGEGPWIETMSPVEAGVLFAGKDPVATDAAATAAMAFDPTADFPVTPFLRADNHLNLAHVLGLGTNRLAEIEVVGASIDEVQYAFQPCWELEQ
jgi:uncharacterized protein (DUF362 family)